MKPLDEMTHAELYALRGETPGGYQGMIAPLEHRAFAREWLEESPWIAGLSLPFAIPAYSIAKALGLQKARTPASMDELFGGFHGYAEGMLNNLVPSAQAKGKKKQSEPAPLGRAYSRDATPAPLGVYNMPPMDEIEALMELNRMLNETPIVSDTTPPATWHKRAVPQTIDDTVDPLIQRGWIHGMPSDSEKRMPQIDPDDYMGMLKLPRRPRWY